MDENGNAVSTFNASLTTVKSTAKKTKRSKGERNTKTCTAEDIEGYRGHDNIESLLSFIENKPETKTKQNVINVNKNIINSERHKKKEKATKKESGGDKLKKSTSMEELKSTSKIEEEIRSERAQVNLRQKQQQQQANKKGADSTKDKQGPPNQSNQQQQPAAQQQPPAPQQPTNQSSNNNNKRGERRSWGTEELNYLGDRDMNTAAGRDDDRDAKKSKDGNGGAANKQNSSSNSSNNNNNYGPKSNKKNEQSVSIISIESIPSTGETAEFHVVTKKKKTKKRQILEEARNAQQNAHGAMRGGGEQNSYGHVAIGRMNSNSKYQPSNNYTNDRDVYMKSLATQENRRKSASSMPPSERSDSSDVDSVHSAPSGQSVPNDSAAVSNGNSKISYAEIAQGKVTASSSAGAAATAADPWPPVSSSSTGAALGAKSAESPDTSNLSTCSTLSAKSQTSGRVNNNNNTINNANNKPIFLDVNESGNMSYVAVAQADIPIGTGGGGGGGAVAGVGTASANTPKQISYSQTLIDDKSVLTLNNATDDTKRALQVAGAVVSIASGKPLLQKSKSEEKDYPALEKTVKPQKQPYPQATPPSDARNPNPAAKPQLKATYSVDSHSCNNSRESSENRPQADEQYGSGVTKAIATDETQAISTPASVATVTKKVKKPNSRSMSDATTNRNHTGQSRPAVIIFNDNDSPHENVSPLLFGDFNDDILQLMKQDADEQFSDDTCQTPTATAVPSEILSPLSDQGYASANNRSIHSTTAAAVAATTPGKIASTAPANTQTPIVVGVVPAFQPQQPPPQQQAPLMQQPPPQQPPPQQQQQQPQSHHPNHQYSNQKHNIQYQPHYQYANNNNNNANEHWYNGPPPPHGQRNVPARQHQPHYHPPGIPGFVTNVANVTNIGDDAAIVAVASNQTINNLATVSYNYNTSNSDAINSKANHNPRSRDNHNKFSNDAAASGVSAGAPVVTGSNWIQNHHPHQSHNINMNNNNNSSKNSQPRTINVVNNSDTNKLGASAAAPSATTIDVNATTNAHHSHTNSSQTSGPEFFATEIICGKDIHVRYVAPSQTVVNAINCNHEKIVNFVGMGTYKLWFS